MEVILENVSKERLINYISEIEGLRHGSANYDELEKKANFIESTLKSFNLKVENQYFFFQKRIYRNIVATFEGIEKDTEYILLGAHYDAAWGSPGADDNASGVAVLLEAANILSRERLNKSIQFVAFTLEEPQPQTIHFLIGSEYFVKEAKKANKRYKAVFILESVGYTDKNDGSQIAPVLVRTPVPKKGDFLAVISNRKSKHLMDTFYNISREYVPELKIVTYKTPLSGRIIPETRFSDHASFWNYGYPALMLTDTAMFRNPYYHTHRDTQNTLDFDFIMNVTKAVITVILKLGNN